MEQDRFVSKIVMLVFMALLALLAFLVVKSILLSIVFGLLLAYVLNPIYVQINLKVKSRSLSAAILILAVIIIIAIPLLIVTPMIAKQTFETYAQLQQINFAEFLDNILPSLIPSELLTTINIQLNNAFGKIFSSLLTQFTNFIVEIPNFVLQLFVVFFILFFSVRDLEKLKIYFTKLSPLSQESEKKFLKEFRTITNTIIYGQFLIAFLQALALGLGLFVLGVPNVLILILITFIISIIPILGPPIVYVPVLLYLFINGSYVTGIILAAYSILFVSSIDNFIRPYILSKSASQLSTAVSLIGIIGGLLAFGIIGVLLGPLILAYVMILIEFYREGRLNELFKK